MQITPFHTQYLHANSGVFGQDRGGWRLGAHVDGGKNADASEGFAQLVTDRLQQRQNAEAVALAEAATAGAPQAATAGAADPSRLGEAFRNTVDFIREEFGDKTAQAAMALVSRQLGKEDVSEEDLGRALLETVKLVDRNFGFAAGDTLMGHLNGELNSALNAYFDNGFQESFFAVTPHAGKHTGGDPYGMDPAVRQTLQHLAQRNAGEEAPDAASLLESLREALQSRGMVVSEGDLTDMESLEPGRPLTEYVQRMAAHLAPAVPGSTGAMLDMRV